MAKDTRKHLVLDAELVDIIKESAIKHHIDDWQGWTRSKVMEFLSDDGYAHEIVEYLRNKRKK